LDDPLALLEEYRIIALRAGPEAPDGKLRIERQSGLDFRLRVVVSAE
jgi:hypothetical protein